MGRGRGEPTPQGTTGGRGEPTATTVGRGRGEPTPRGTTAGRGDTMGWGGRGGLAALHHIYIYIFFKFVYAYIYIYAYAPQISESLLSSWLSDHHHYCYQCSAGKSTACIINGSTGFDITIVSVFPCYSHWPVTVSSSSGTAEGSDVAAM